MVQIPEELAERLTACKSLPAPSPVANQVIELAQNPEMALGTVADTISGDPAIAAKVMEIANSAIYARRRQSTNLRQAMIVLGLNATLTLALSFTLVASLRKGLPQAFDFDAFWRRAVLAATWGKLLGSESGRNDAEEVFLAAMLQDLGMLAIDKIAPEVYAGISPFQLEHQRVAQHEKTQLATDHRAVGAWLLKEWNMPEQICVAVQHSHDITAGGVDPNLKSFVRSVAMSGALADVWINDRNEIGIRRAGLEAHRNLGILPNRMAELFVSIGEQLPIVENIFEMNLFAPEQLQNITHAAREILMINNLHTIPEHREVEEEQHREPEAGREELREAASRDGLTNVYTRRYFEEALTREFETASQHNWPMSVVVVDLDRVKQINDTHGHHAGDLLLQEVAALLKSNLRDTDMVARYGGDEFALLLPGLDAAKAAEIGARLVTQARGQTVSCADGQVLHMTLSLGTATHAPGAAFEKPADLLAAANRALHHSKRNGRNRHTSYETIEAA